MNERSRRYVKIAVVCFVGGFASSVTGGLVVLWVKGWPW